MAQELAPLYAGPLAWLRGRTLLADEAPDTTLAASDVFTPDGLDRMIELHAPNYPPGDARALLSIWSKYYLAAAIYTPVAALVMLGRALPVTLDDIGVVPGATGEVWQLVLPHTGDTAPEADAASRFLPLIDANLGPAIERMAAHSGLAPRVFWSNAGHYFDHLAQTLITMPGVPPAAYDVARMLQLRHLADGRRNPLFRPLQDMTDAQGARRRMRRLCCVRFRLPGVDYCDNCPLLLHACPATTSGGANHPR